MKEHTADILIPHASVLNVATDAHILSMIGASGSMRFAIVFVSTETGSTRLAALLNTVIRRCCYAVAPEATHRHVRHGKLPTSL